MNPCINIFCEPTNSLDTIAARLEWSAAGVTYQSGPAPAGTQVYLRVTAAGVDFSGYAQFILTGGVGGGSWPVNGVGGLGSFTGQTSAIGFGASDYVVTLDGSFDCGTIIFA
jgi:hypothetical protein